MEIPKFSPMLAVSGTPFDSEEHLFEIKWDGIRALALIDQGKTKLFSRNGNDITHRYPELELGESVNQTPVVLDGEIVVLKDGLPSFHTLQTRDHLLDPRKIRAAAQATPAVYIVFDLLFVAGSEQCSRPLLERKQLLNSVVIEGTNLLVSQFIIAEGKNLFKLSKDKGLEGVMAKRLDSPYLVGKRSGYWVKFRNVKSMSCIICGYLHGSGSRNDLGSLILGVYQKEKLRYIGNVGSGLDSKEIKFLLDYFQQTSLVTSPFENPPNLKNPIYVRPELVCEVNYLERSTTLRHPTFVGLRRDLLAKDCLWEQE